MDELDREVERQAAAWRARLSELRGKHVAIEALWDGDTVGWFLRIAVVTRKSWWRPGPWTTADHYAQPLADLRYGSDLRLMNRQVPPWPEAIVARRAGEQVAGALGLELFIPSPDHPESACPHWWERDSAIPCDTCGTLLCGDRGPNVPPDRCYHCTVEAEIRQELIDDAPVGAGEPTTLLCVAEGEGEALRCMPLSDRYDVAGVFERLAAILRAREPAVVPEHVSTTLSPDELASLRSFCEDGIDARLARYADGPFPPERAGAYSFRWRGVERTVQSIRPLGLEIRSLLAAHALFDPAGAPARLHVFGERGLTARGLAFLRFAAERAGACSSAELEAAFPFLPADAVERTLTKLAEGSFLEREVGTVRLSLKGRAMAAAHP
jgi:hypothetical protein